VLRLLVEAGAKPNEATKNGNTALRAAVLLGDADVLVYLIEQGAEVDMETGRGTALITACSQGDCDMAALLIDKGAKPNFESRSGATPLISAVREDHSEVVKVLLQRGADPELTTADGASAVQIAQLKALPMTLALLMQAIVVRDADNVLRSSEQRQEEAAVTREQKADQALQEAQERQKSTRAETDSKISDLKAENERLRALYGSKK